MSIIFVYLSTRQTLNILAPDLHQRCEIINGTFINGERLSPEGVESDPVEIKNEDQIVS